MPLFNSKTGKRARSIQALLEFKPFTERLWEKIERAGPNECWFWKGSKTKRGYGLIRFNGRITKTAHRAVWEEKFGAIPIGMEICHKCDQPSCTNIRHLFMGTHTDNMRDALAKGRLINPRAGKSGFVGKPKKLTAEKVRDIRRRFPAESAINIGKRYGIIRNTVYAILNRKAWKHVV